MPYNILHLIYDHVNNPWVGGGGAVRVYEIYKKLSQRGHHISIVSGRHPGAKDHTEENLEFKFIGIGKNYAISIFSYLFYAQKYILKNYKNYDVIVEDFAVWNPLMCFRLQGRPVILQIQNYLGKELLKQYSFLGLPFYLIERFYAKLFKNKTVLTPSLNKRFNIAGTVISQGVDRVDMNKCTACDNYIAFMGRIDIYQKGIDVLIKACRNIPLTVKIAGDGKDKERFTRMSGRNNNIDWLGKIKGEEKRYFLEKSMFLIAPSRYEGQSITILEAAACAKPVIVSDIPELEYAVEAGFGLSFKAGDAKDLEDKMRFLLENKTLRLQMGQKAREYAKDYTWDKIALDYENFLTEVINNG